MSTALQTELLTPEPSAPAFALRPYQEEAIAAILAGRDRGLQRMLIVMATGAGKTVVFSHLAHRLGCRTLVLAHRDELIEQAANKLRAVLGTSVPVGVVKAERNEIHASVIVGSIQTVTNAKRLKQLPSDLGLIVVDEAHHSAAETYMHVLKQLGCFRPGGPLLLGVTATPDRGDKKRIGHTVYQEQVYTKSMRDLIDDGYLCDVRARAIMLDADLSRVRTTGGDFQAEELSAALMAAGAIPHIVTAYEQYAEGRKGLVFTPSVAMAYKIAALFQEKGIAAEAIDGTTHPELRRATLRRLAAGTTRIVVNCAVLTEGFDEPSIGCVIIARPTQSRPLFVQMIGRGLRIHPGKTDCSILDLVANAGKHDVASIPDVFGLPPDQRDVASVKKAAKEAEERRAGIRQAKRLADEQAALAAREFDLLKRGTRLHWVPVHDGRKRYLALSLGTGLLKLGEAAPGDWCVVYNDVGARLKYVVGHYPDQRTAIAAAEAHALRYGKPWAFRPNLPWRDKPASLKTRTLARAIGCTLPRQCTAGDASDRILVHQALHGLTS